LRRFDTRRVLQLAALERTLDAVAEYGYDGLELRLLDGEPIDPSAVDGAARRILARTQVPLVSLDTSIELARPFARDLEAAATTKQRMM
jgi:sugar phosphate isomerase/epimerase